MDKEIQISPKLTGKADESKLFLDLIPSDVLFALSLPIYLNNHDKDNNLTEKLRAIQQRNDCAPSDCVAYAEFCELFDNFDRDGDVAKFCKKTYSSKISKVNRDFYDAINTFCRIVRDNDVNKDKEHTARIKRMSEETELNKTDIALLEDKIQKNIIEYDEKVLEYEKEKKYYDNQVKNAYREANFYRARIETKNKQEMFIYIRDFENEITELEKFLEKKKKQSVVWKENNMVETERLKKELLKKWAFLKTINEEYNDDMLLRYKKKTYLQQTIKSRKDSLKTLKENSISMGTYLEKLKEEERISLKREFYDKLDAIKEKIALRAITKFLMPYILNEFGPRKTTKKTTKN
ncbi:Hypothetical protein CINCED_3A002857 [Cinara cedri]|uniref:Uncharacterized protein n=1 Tax=Cinara cedri TaxID=506608 RepID=A0A5E4NLH6_9HEMI|nr:Hypothetical protein CINCED_3A002857 [Cinara cedri]